MIVRSDLGSFLLPDLFIFIVSKKHQISIRIRNTDYRLVPNNIFYVDSYYYNLL